MTEIGDEGLAAFFTTLRQTVKRRSQLRSIYLNGTGAGVQAATTLGAFLAVEQLCSLEDIFMSCNSLTLEAVKALADGISKNTTLK